MSSLYQQVTHMNYVIIEFMMNTINLYYNQLKLSLFKIIGAALAAKRAQMILYHVNRIHVQFVN